MQGLIELANKAMEVIGIMPGDQISSTLLGLVGIVASAIFLKGIGSTIVKEAFKTKRKTIAMKRALSKDEVEKKSTNSLSHC